VFQHATFKKEKAICVRQEGVNAFLGIVLVSGLESGLPGNEY